MTRVDYGNVTLAEVAALAGVSRATASRVLAGKTNTAPATRAVVRAAAERLGYQLNPVASALARAVPTPRDARGGRIVYAVVARSADAVATDLYLARSLAAAAETARPFGAGVGFEWLDVRGSRALERLAADATVHGVVLVNTTEAVLESIPARLRGRVVSIGVGADGVPAYDVDNGPAAVAITRHLVGCGRREIAMVTGPRWLPCTRPQTSGYVTAMAEAGLPARTVPGDFSYQSGVVATGFILRRWPRTDAIFAACDSTALGVMAALREAGRRVGSDVAVVGFDDIPIAGQISPALTTSTHPVGDIARAATLALLDPSRRDLLPHLFASHLVLRQTA